MVYIATNRNASSPRLWLKNIFAQFGHKDHLKKYETDFEHLKSMHREASQHGNLLLVSVTPEQAQKLNIKPVNPDGGRIRPVIISGKEITDIQTIIEAYRHYPERVKYMNTIECTLLITREVLDPRSGIRIYSMNNADQKKYAQLTEFQDLLIARLQLEQLQQQETKKHRQPRK